MIKIIIYLILYLVVMFFLVKLIKGDNFDIVPVYFILFIFSNIYLFDIEELKFGRLIGLLVIFYVIIRKNLLKKINPKIYVCLICILTSLVFIAYIKSIDIEGSRFKFVNYIFTFFIPIFFMPPIINLKSVKRIYTIWVIIALISTVLSFLQIFYGHIFYLETYYRNIYALKKFFDYSSSEYGYYSGFGLFAHRSHNALFISVALFYITSKFMEKKVNPFIAIFLILIFILGLLLTRARAGTILGIIGFIFTIIYHIKIESRRIKILILLLILFVSVGFVALQYYSDILNQYFLNPLIIRLSAESEISNISRIVLWKKHMAIMNISLRDLLRPFGIRFGVAPPDNIFLTVGFEIGFIALVIFVLFYILLIINSYKLTKAMYGSIIHSELLANTLGLVIYFLHLMVGNLYFYGTIFPQVLPVLVYLSIIYHLKNINKSNIRQYNI